jgi:ComEC/Rec2-related protein
VVLTLPKTAKHLEYNNFIQVRGTLLKPNDPIFSGGFDFSKYLNIRHIYSVLNVTELKRVEQSHFSVMGTLLKGRDFILRHLTATIQQQENKAMIAALFLGCKQGVDKEVKGNYIRSGTIHIFTVSGLHVGMVALLLFLFFRFIPFKQRHIIVPLITLVYVMMIGGHPSAVRAFIMLSIWSLNRAFLRRPESLNTVFFAAFIVLLMNPLYCIDSGFQFSFITVTFLILGVEGIQRWVDVLSEQLTWIPRHSCSRWQILKNKIFIWAFTGVSGCFIAWVASSGVGQLHQGIYAPTTIFANMLIIPLVWVIFIFFFPLFILGTIPVLGSGMGYVLEHFK